MNFLHINKLEKVNIKSTKKSTIVQFICFAIAVKTRTLSALLTQSSKKHHCEDRSIPTCQ
jgi:uncharacterized protein with PQ loop repeat